MTKDKLIEALETALAELKQPTITFTLPKREPLSFDDLNAMWCGNPIDFARCIESIHGIGVDDE